MPGKYARLLILALTLCFFVFGCGKVQNASQNIPKGKGKVSATQEKEKEKPPYSVENGKIVNNTGKVIIKSATNERGGNYNTSYLIVSSKGTVIVADPYKVTDEVSGIAPDIITVSHNHPDHNDNSFFDKNDCKKVKTKAETFTVNDVKVTGIPAAHKSGDIDKEYTSNVINVYEVDGLRLAHFGDMGQDQLTDEQLASLGKIDIAFTVFTEAPQYGTAEQKTIKLLQQVKPSIVVPTHNSPEVVENVLKAVGIEEKEETETLIISKGEIKEGKTKYLFLK